MNVGIAFSGKEPEVAVIAGERVVFSTFSFFGKLRERLERELERQGWKHEPGLDGEAVLLLEKALSGEDVFDWSRVSRKARDVLKELRGVGETITYGELAKRCGSSPRAVGSIMRSNPFAYFVPCHRVVARDGEGGFAIGIEEKRRLLEKEARASRRG